MEGASPLITLIDRARAFLNLSLDAVQQTLGDDAYTVSGDEYGNMSNLTSMESPQRFPGTVYVEDDSVVLVRVNRRGLADVSPEAFRTHLGDGAVRLRSCAGKTAHLLVYAERGIAYSAQGETVHFLEAFLPCIQREYERRIYRDPGIFIR